MIACKKANSTAFMYGTFVAGILCATRRLSAPANCLGCEVIWYPIFSEQHTDINEATGTITSSTPEELSKAIVQT